MGTDARTVWERTCYSGFLEGLRLGMDSVGELIPGVIRFCCSDCRRARRRAGKSDQSGQVMGIAYRLEERWYWGDVRQTPLDQAKIRSRNPLDARTSPIIMNCRVPSHPPRTRLPDWIISRAERAIDEGPYLAVHV